MLSRLVSALALLTASLCVAPRAVRAGNEDEFFVGNRAAMVGGAVTATVADSSATYYNPAGLGAIGRDSLNLSASAYGFRRYKVPNFLSTQDGDHADSSVFEWFAIPTSVGYVRALTDRVKLGLGYFAPRTSSPITRERLDTKDEGLTSTWSVAVSERSQDYVLAAALGMAVSDIVRIGGGIYGIYQDTVDDVSVFGEVERGGSVSRLVELSSLSTYSRLGLELGLGVQVNLPFDLTLGLAARGPRLQVFRMGQDSLTYTTLDMADDGSAVVAPTSAFADQVGSRVGFLTLGRAHVALARRFGEAVVAAEFDVSPGLTSPTTGVRKAFTWNARAGATFPVADHATLGAGLFTDRSSGELNDLFSSRVHFYGATLGLELESELGLAEGSRSESLQLLTVFALRYAYGTGAHEVLALNPTAESGQLFSSESGRQRVHEMVLTVGSALNF